MTRVHGLAGLVAVLVVGCKNRDGIDFPSTLGPLDSQHDAPALGPSGGETYPEVLKMTSGKDRVAFDEEKVFWAHASAYLQASVEDVYAAARSADVVVDRREVETWTITDDTVPEFEHSFTIHNEVEDVLKVEYDMTWVYETQDAATAEGDDPTRVVAQWDKTDGTDFIKILRGSLELDEVEPGITELRFQEHLQAALRDEKTLETYLQDLYNSLKADVHGKSLPTY